MEQNKIIAAYVRTATLSYSSILAQVEKVIAELLSEEASISTQVVFYIDYGYSALEDDRPAFNSLMQDISNGTVDTVLISDPSRLSRNMTESSQVKQLADLNEVSVITIGY